MRTAGSLASLAAALLLGSLRGQEPEARDSKEAGLRRERNTAALAIGRAHLLYTNGRPAEAAEALKEARTILGRLGDQRGLAEVAMNLGSIYAQRERHEEALGELEAAWTLFTGLGDERGKAGVAVMRAYVFEWIGRVDEAWKELAVAESHFGRVGDKGMLAIVAGNRGLILQKQERLEEALQDFESAIRVAHEKGMDVVEGTNLLNRAIVLAALGRLDESLETYQRTESLFRSAQQEWRLAFVAENKAETLRANGRHEEAMRELDRAWQMNMESGNQVGLARTSCHRASCLLARGRSEDALEEYRRGADLLEGFLGTHVQPLGEQSSVAFRSGFHGELLDGAVRILRDAGGGRKEVLAKVYRLLQVFHGLGMAELLAEKGNIGSLRIPEELRKEHQQALARLQAAGRKLASLRTRTAPETPDALRELEEVRRNMRAEVAREEHDLHRLQERVRVLSPSYAAVVYPKAASLEEVQAVLPAGTALVEFMLGKKTADAFLVTGDAAKAVALPEPEELRKDAALLLAAMTQATGSPGPDLGRALRALGRKLLDPLLSLLPPAEGTTTLLVSADGELCRIPFEALLTEDVRDGVPPARWPFLVRRFAVAYVHSGTVLREMALEARAPPQAARRLCALGHPLYPAEPVQVPASMLASLDYRSGFRPLPGTAQEVLRIARLFAEGDEEQKLAEVERILEADPSDAVPREIVGRRFALLLRGAATESAVKTRPEVREASVLHLACHGQADLESPALSHLVLSQSGAANAQAGEDGFLTLRELRDLGLRAELVVLSACESNAGRLRPLEGLTGLSRAALAAGSRSVLSTLWEVPDRAARDLMVDFYRAWIEAGLSKAVALAHAKRNAIERGVPPRTWASFILWDAGR